MTKYTDQIGNTILLDQPPKGIVSLVPSQTELLYSLGLNEKVVGITKFCIHPNSWYRTKPRVGGTKNINFEKIASLNPDLIIANKEENTESEIKKLISLYPTWVSDIKTLLEALNMIKSLGEITKTDKIATKIIEKINFSFNNAQKSTKNESVLYLIWNNPIMSINSDTFINDMLYINNWKNCVADNTTRYPELSIDDIKKLDPDFIFLSSEPFPFKKSHQNQFQNQFPNSKVLLVDGEMFSWYGSRLLKAPKYFNKLHQIINLR